MIYVCDAIMGSGKSSAAITYMKEHSSDKFIYITPYLEEAERIKRGCPQKRFAEPNDKIPKYHFKKCEHTADLIKQGRNIATTHQAFKMYTEEMLEDIRNQGYRLIVDENVEVLEKYECSADDIRMAVDAGYVKKDGNLYSLVRDDYNGQLFKELFGLMKVRDLIVLSEDKNNQETLFCWTLPPALIDSFKDVFILTYLFKGQSLHHFLEMYKMDYKYIGVSKCTDGAYKFSDQPELPPNYVFNLKNKIHICENDKLNDIGKAYHALSMNWYNSKSEGVSKLKTNIYNYMHNVCGDISANDKMWGCFKNYSNRIKGKGYTKGFVIFNMRATNAFRNKHHLVYAANLFMNVSEKNFYKEHGIDTDEDIYALSIMVQWVWRSAIRDGDEIWIYIPSKRMRTLLSDWIETVSKGGNVYETRQVA